MSLWYMNRGLQPLVSSQQGKTTPNLSPHPLVRVSSSATFPGGTGHLISMSNPVPSHLLPRLCPSACNLEKGALFICPAPHLWDRGIPWMVSVSPGPWSPLPWLMGSGFHIIRGKQRRPGCCQPSSSPQLWKWRGHAERSTPLSLTPSTF